MKTFLSLVIAVFGFVVGLQGSQRQIQVPDSLPIGTGFPVDIVIAVDIGNEDGNVSHAEFNYDPSDGSLEMVVVQGLRNLAAALVVPNGTENQDYWVAANAWRIVETEKGKEYWSIASNFPGYNPERFFKLENSRIPSRILDVTVAIDLGGVRVYAKGLSEVTSVLQDESGNDLSSETSPNGISDKTCSGYPGGSAYTPDALIVDPFVAYPPFWETYKKFFGATVDFSPRRGYYILRFGPDKAVWAKYDLETGRKLDSNEPTDTEPVALAISLVQLDETGKVALLSKKSLQWGLKLSVRGPTGKSAILEYADRIDGSWKQLSTLSLIYGSEEVVEPLSTGSRFYRVR